MPALLLISETNARKHFFICRDLRLINLNQTWNDSWFGRSFGELDLAGETVRVAIIPCE